MSPLQPLQDDTTARVAAGVGATLPPGVTLWAQVNAVPIAQWLVSVVLAAVVPVLVAAAVAYLKEFLRSKDRRKALDASLDSIVVEVNEKSTEYVERLERRIRQLEEESNERNKVPKPEALRE